MTQIRDHLSRKPIVVSHRHRPRAIVRPLHNNRHLVRSHETALKNFSLARFRRSCTYYLVTRVSSRKANKSRILHHVGRDARRECALVRTNFYVTALAKFSMSVYCEGGGTLLSCARSNRTVSSAERDFLS